MKITLHTLRAAALPSSAEGEALPTRLVVFPWGTHNTRRGKFIVSDLTAKVFEANQGKMRLDGKLALDFEHNTLPGTEAYKSSAEPRPVAAWALCKVIPGEGLVYEDIEWTPEGLAAMKGGHFRDLSPSPFRDEAGNVIGLHSVALCRHGEVEGLTLHAAASPRVAAYLSALSADALTTSTETTPAMKDALLKLLKSLGIELEAEASEESMTAALSAAATKVGALKPAEAKAEGMSASEAVALRAEMDDLRKSNLISEATRDGKVIPLSADAIKAAPLSVITELVAAAKPGQVHQNGNTTTSENPDKDKQPEALSAETLDLAAKMGLTADEIRKYAPAAA